VREERVLVVTVVVFKCFEIGFLAVNIIIVSLLV